MADPPWLPGCKANIAKIPNAQLCSDQHCTDAQNQGHMVCYCCPPYQNGCSGQTPPANCGGSYATPCCSYTAESPFPVFQPTGMCYCCCGCLAFDTSIMVSASEVRPIQDIRVGDMMYVAMDADLKRWDQIPVQFSSGTGADSVSGMVKIKFGDEKNPDWIIATRNQLFLLPGKVLKRASTLVPEQDQLLRPDGTTVVVRSLESGDFKKGTHMIATSNQVTTEMSGHLMVANGVVCGDYSLQLTNLEATQPKMMAGGGEELPEFGTKEYGERYKHLFADAYTAHIATATFKAAAEGEEGGTPGFTPHALAKEIVMPPAASSFFTEDQAVDIQSKAPQAPILSGAGRDITAYLFKLFAGFYPKVHFYVDDTNSLPNAYSFVQFDIPIVVVNGGLIRTVAVQYESLAFIIAHQLAALYGGDPEGEDGYSCRGQADFAALAAIIPYVWFGYYAFPMMQPAIDQINRLFDFISPEHSGGLPGNRCNLIAIDCRRQCLAAAISMMPLPECAGGPPTATLEVKGATAAAGPGDKTSITVTYSEKVDVESAQSLGNYSFNPIAPTQSVVVQAPGYNTAVVVGTFEPGTNYTLTVHDVVSANKNPLVRGKASAPFTTPPQGDKAV